MSKKGASLQNKCADLISFSLVPPLLSLCPCQTRLVESMVGMAAARLSFNPSLRDMLATSTCTIIISTIILIFQ
jgi:hypothetical protein